MSRAEFVRAVDGNAHAVAPLGAPVSTLAPMREFGESPQPTASPWGAVQTAMRVAAGIWFVSTASHGGYLLSTERRLAMPEHLKTVHTFAGHDWFEHDCDWCLVALAFPDTFPPGAMEHARATLLTFDHEPRDAFERGSVYHKTMRRAAQAVRALEVSAS